jgi:hypothetical protein
MAGRVITNRKKHQVIFKVEKKHLLALPLELEQFRPQGVEFVVEEMNVWDRFKLRKHCFRMELR